MASAQHLSRARKTEHLIYGYIGALEQAIDDEIPSEIYSLCILFHGLLLVQDSTMIPILQLVDLVFDDWAPSSLEIIDYYYSILQEAGNNNNADKDVQQAINDILNKQPTESKVNETDADSELIQEFNYKIRFIDSTIDIIQGSKNSDEIINERVELMKTITDEKNKLLISGYIRNNAVNIIIPSAIIEYITLYRWFLPKRDEEQEQTE